MLKGTVMLAPRLLLDVTPGPDPVLSEVSWRGREGELRLLTSALENWK